MVSMRRGLLAGAFLAAALVSAAGGGEPAAAGYTLKDGVFSVPLEVRDNQNLARKAWPACFGVPLPLGLVKEPGDLRLLNSAGGEVPCQFTALSRYWARDNSVRWVLLDFQADVPAGGKAVYKLTNDKPAAAVADPVKVEDGAEALTVSTGALKVVISKKRCSLFESVSVGGKEVVKAAEHDGPRATAEAQDYEHRSGGDWNLHGWEGCRKEQGVHPIKRADYFGDVGAPEEVAVERSGPLHVIVRVRGAYLPTEKGKDVLEHGVYNFTCRVHFYRGKDYVRVEHSVENSRFQEPRFQTKLLDHSLWTTLALDGELACTYGGADGKSQSAQLKAGEELSVYGPKAEEVKARWLDVSAGGARVGVAARTRGEAQALEVAGGRLAVRPYSIHYGQAHPLSSLTEKSWGAGGFQLDFGSRTTYDFYYRFSAGQGTSLAELSSGMLWPLFGFAPPAWYSDAAVWNMDLSPANARRGRIKDGAAFDLESKDGQGLLRKWDFNSGGHHGNLSSLYDTALMTGNLTELQRNYAVTNFNVDFYQWNYRGHEPTNDPEKLKHAHRMIMFGPKDLHLYGKKGQNSGTHFCSYKYLPDFEHYAFIHLWEQYYLWGDARARESLMRFANFSVTFEWDVAFLREGEKNGIPPLDRVDYFDQHHAALWRSHYARIYSWQFYTPLEAYQATGDPVYDLLSRWQLRRFSHLQRLSRGIAECWNRSYWNSAEQKTWKKIDYPDEKDVTTFQFRAQQWMIGKTMLGFHEAWRTYGDEEILDNIWGECDYFMQVPWRGPGQGIPNAPLIPATLMGKPSSDKQWTPNYHMRTGQALSLAWLYTGEPELKKRMEDHVVGKLDGKTWGNMSTWVRDKKGGRDQPPAAVTDLKCVKADREGLVFEWTAPAAHGRSGRAARYFLKYSTKPIVKWAPVNNPQAPEDPFADRNLHTYKPECWHPDFLKKDAFWMATHVEGEPVPGAPGKKETCTVTVVKPYNYYGLPLEKMPRVKDLPAGKYCFALCSWDEDGNLSDVSNLVEVELK